MKANKEVCLFSLLGVLISMIGIIPCSIYKGDCVVIEVILNIFISLFAGAVLSVAAACVNFLITKREKTVAFITGYIAIFNRICNLADWYNIRKYKVNYTVGGNADDMDELLRAKEENDKQNAVIVKEFYCALKNISAFDFNELYCICDDYCNTIWRKENSKKGVKAQMIEMLSKVSQYDYLQNLEAQKFINFYEQKVYNEAIIFDKVVPMFEAMVAEDKIRELKRMESDLLKTTKINIKLNKIYG